MNANIFLWKLFKNEEINSSQLINTFKNNNVVSNRILLKPYEKALPTQSYWQNYKRYSVLRHMSKEADMVSDKLYENAIVMLGTSYNNNGDTFQVLNFFGSEVMSGIEIHANVLMTLFYFDGQLELMPFCFSIFLIAILIFLTDFSSAMLLRKYGIAETKWTLFFTLIFALVLMVLIAWVFLHFGYWFDWFAPTVLLDSIL